MRGLEGDISFNNEVIIKAGQTGGLDAAVLACADIDLYSRRPKASRLRGGSSPTAQLQAIPEGNRLDSSDQLGVSHEPSTLNDPRIPACESISENAQQGMLMHGAEAMVSPGDHLTTQASAPAASGGMKTRSAAALSAIAVPFSAFQATSLPAVQGIGLQSHTGFKRSFSDPCSLEAGKSKPKRHNRCLTEVAVTKPRGIKLPESSLKSLIQGAKPPLRDRRRHKRVQSIDVTNDPTSCKLVSTL